MQVAIVLYPGFTALDFIGPYESLRWLPDTEVRFVWHEPGPIVADSGVLLGATFVGPEAAELIHAATVAIVGGVPVAVLRHAVPSYPTASELWLRLLEALPRELR